LNQHARPSESGTLGSGTVVACAALDRRFAALLMEAVMLWTIAVILIVLWLLGVVVHIGGGLIHLLLVVAIIVGLIQLFTGRRAL
jgi:hypothetical protein